MCNRYVEILLLGTAYVYSRIGYKNLCLWEIPDDRQGSVETFWNFNWKTHYSWQTIRSVFQGQEVKSKKNSFLLARMQYCTVWLNSITSKKFLTVLVTLWLLMTRPIGCVEKSVTNYQHTPRTFQKSID